MPTEVSKRVLEHLRVRRVARLAIGTALAMLVSQAYGWSLSYIAPILTLVVLSLPASRPQARFFVVVIAATLVSVYGSFIFLPMLIHQPAAGLLLVALALFHTFYFTACGKPAVVGTLFTIGITLTVAVGSVSVDALLAVAQGVSFGVLVGVVIAWFMHIVLPDPELPEPAHKPTPPVAANPLRSALRSLTVVLPIAIWFLFSMTSATNAAVMIKVAAMGQEASTGEVKNAARSLLVSTAAGGLAAVLAWQVLTVWPSLLMYALLVAIAGLFFGGKIFAGRGLAAEGATWSYALLTMIVILAPAALDSQFGNAANVNFYKRLWMLMGASLYGVVAVYVFDAFWPPGRKSGSAATVAAQVAHNN